MLYFGVVVFFGESVFFVVEVSAYEVEFVIRERSFDFRADVFRSFLESAEDSGGSETINPVKLASVSLWGTEICSRRRSGEEGVV